MKVAWIIILICIAFCGYSQSTDTLSHHLTSQDEPVFYAVEQPAEFVGGMDGLSRFLTNTIVYPVKAFRKRIEGRVFAKFIVEKDGSITNIKIIKGAHPLLDAEAIRVISLSPNWIPGKQSGRTVRSQFVLPVQFSLKR